MSKKTMSEFLDNCYEAIINQPASFSRTLAPSNQPDAAERLKKASRIFLTGSGDSYAASLFGDFVFSKLGLKTRAFEAADAEYFSFKEGDVLIAISASGRSTQLLQAVERAAKAKVETFGLTENPKSALTEVADHLWLTLAHPRSFDISPSSTTTSAMAVLLWIGEEIFRTVNPQIPPPTQILTQRAEKALKWGKIWGKQVANEIKGKEPIFLLGFGPTYVAAVLGMMKLHEYAVAKGISMHMEEFAHHTKLIVNEGDQVILLPPRNFSRKAYFNMLEQDIQGILRAKLSVAQPPSDISSNNELVDTIFMVFPLQFLAYFLAKDHEPPILGWREPQVTAFKIYKED